MRRRLRGIAEFVAALAIVILVLWGGLGGLMPVRVAGRSMHPALEPGDLVAVRLGARPKPGTIALLHEDGHGAVLHRVVELLGDGSVRTRGDANPVDDLEPTPASAVKGSVVAVIPVGRVLARWRGDSSVRYHGDSTEQREATTETTPTHTPPDQGRAH